MDLYELGGKHVRYERTPLSATIVPLLSVTRLLACIWVDETRTNSISLNNNNQSPL